MDNNPSAADLESLTRHVRGVPAWIRWAAPLAVAALLLAAWEAIVRIGDVPAYKLPAPSVIAATIYTERASLTDAWQVTVSTMLTALALAVIAGVALAAAFASSLMLEATLLPYAVILQVTPLVAVAPFMVLWLGDRVWLAQVLCAWIVAFFPILSNTLIGLRSVDRGRVDLFNLYRATPWQKLRLLRAPSALPYFLAGLKISASLALVGAIVGEFVIGPSAERPGLATTILASQLRLDTPMMFAALAIVSLTGVLSYAIVQAVSYWLLRGWHESSMRKT
jgi:NitT/TauT family transport system permease protein